MTAASPHVLPCKNPLTTSLRKIMQAVMNRENGAQ